MHVITVCVCGNDESCVTLTAGCREENKALKKERWSRGKMMIMEGYKENNMDKKSRTK